MKILLLINTFGPGGAERSTLELAKYLIAQGVTVVLVALNEKEVGITEEFTSLPAQVYIGNGDTRSKRLRFLVDIIKKEKPDIVHSVIFEANLLARLARLFTPPYVLVQSLVNTPYVTGRRLNTGVMGKFKFQLAKLADIVSARLTDIHYHTITDTVIGHYQPLFNIRREQYTKVYRGRALSPCADKTAADDERKGLRLINVGRQDYQKGQPLIIEAMAQLQQKGMDDIILDIYGRDGSESREIKKTIARTGLADRVHLRGFNNRVSTALCEADVFVFPSHFEGLGGALIEAMARGLPCICSDIPVLREVIGSPDGALFFEPGNPTELAECIQQLYRRPARRKELAAAARQRFEEAFELEAISRQMLDLYRQLYVGEHANVES